MDVKDKPLRQALMRDYIKELTEPGEEFQKGELLEKITKHHKDLGGADSKAAKPDAEFQKAIDSLSKQNVLTSVRHGVWKRTENIPPTEADMETEAREKAEIRIGDGPEMVYAWYLPAYRELAEREGKTVFAMKIGRTSRTAESRAKESVGQIPERPKFGFVLCTHDASSQEKRLHAHLRIEGRHLPDATGDEWFLTSPAELQRIQEGFERLCIPKDDDPT